MIPFAQARPLILTLSFSVRKVSDFIYHLRSLVVSLFISIGIKHVLSCGSLNSANSVVNPLTQNLFVPFDKSYV